MAAIQVQPQVEPVQLQNWLNDRQAEGFAGRLAANHYSLPQQAAPAKPMPPSRNGQVSLSVDYPTPSSTGTNVVPALSNSAGTISESSVATEWADHVANRHILDVDSNDDDLLLARDTHQPVHRFPCIFHFLDCEESFERLEEWVNHNLSHFRSRPAPTKAQCPLCPKYETHPDHNVAFKQILYHVADDHFRRGHTLSTARPDFCLYKYLFNHGIIDKPRYKALFMEKPQRPNEDYASSTAPRQMAVSNEPFVMSARRREDRNRPRAHNNRGTRRP